MVAMVDILHFFFRFRGGCSLNTAEWKSASETINAFDFPWRRYSIAF